MTRVSKHAVVQVYEIDGDADEDSEVKVRFESHWNDPHRVNLVVPHGTTLRSYTLVAEDVREALRAVAP